MIQQSKTYNQLLKELEELKLEYRCLKAKNKRDVRNLKKFHSALEVSYDQECELKELKSRFISLVSHELRTPLASVVASSDFLEMAGPNYDNEKKSKHFARIRRNVDYILNVLNKIITINKMDNNKIKVTATNVNLPELCAALFNEIQALYPKIKSELVINLKDSLYKVDEVLMRNILGNLISNAFQYNTEYGHVVLNVNLVSNSIVYHIVDTGIGIPLEEQINLFIPFTRMSNSLHTRGTGLGLSIIKGSVKKLGGAISFESKENAGSSFTVFIPIM